MKAAQINTYGGPDVIEIVTIDTPPIASNQVLVKVMASSLNPFDTKVREGMMKDSIPLQLPITLGGDISGVVQEVGNDVTSLTVGDSVYGQANAVSGASGAFAEFAQTAASQLAKAPASISLTEAASLPLVGVSALQAITEHLNVQPGQRLFIHGGAGGIGSIAIQIAKNIGAEVTVSIKGAGMEHVRQLGAHQVIDVDKQPLESLPAGQFDALLDLVGGSDFTKLFTTLRPGGTAVSTVASGYEDAAKEHGISAMTQMTKVTTERLARLADLVNTGAIIPNITQTFSLDAIRQAFEARESGGVSGKIVITIAENPS